MSESDKRRLLIVGCGFLGRALCAQGLAQGRAVTATTRSPERAIDLSRLGATAALLDGNTDLRALVADADVVVTYPPDEAMDDAVARACHGHARALVYISSTAVYGATRGTIDDRTPVASDSDAGDARLRAEARFRQVGGIVLRAPGIYGPGRGVHTRMQSGRYKLTGDGSNHLSRIQVEDLAGLCLAALEQAKKGETYVVGDLEPATQRAVAEFVCDRLGLPLPPSQPVEAAHRTLRGDRQVDPQRALRELRYALRYPNFRVGIADALRREREA